MGGHAVGKGRVDVHVSVHTCCRLMSSSCDGIGILARSKLPMPFPWGFGKWFQKQRVCAQWPDSEAFETGPTCAQTRSAMQNERLWVDDSPCLHPCKRTWIRVHRTTSFIEAALPTKTIAVPVPRPTKAPVVSLLSVPKPCMEGKKSAALRRFDGPSPGA
jgi:hypothetical protein